MSLSAEEFLTLTWHAWRSEFTAIAAPYLTKGFLSVLAPAFWAKSWGLRK